MPNNPHAKEKIEKQVVMDITNTYYPKKPVVPFIKATQDRVTLEVQRGCIRGCRFCQAGMLYRPTRERDVKFLKDTAKAMLDSTGHEEISLSSLSTSDYSKLQELLEYLIDDCSERKVNISLPSLRIDSFSLENGYLTISAAKGLDKDKQDEKGNYIRRERYAGAMSRSFYVGEQVQQEDIHAKFEDGILRLTVPKEVKKQVEDNKYISIEG